MTTPVAPNIDPDAILANDIDGLVVCAPKGTAAPADASADWDGTTGKWEAFGIIADDGITTSYKKDTNEKMGWNVRGVVKRIPKSASFTAKFTAMQTSYLTHKVFYGSAPTTLTNGTQTKLLAKSDTTEYAYGFDMPFTDGTLDRYVVPIGVVTDIDDVVYSQDEVKQFGLTVAAQISASVDYLALLMSTSDKIVVPS